MKIAIEKILPNPEQPRRVFDPQQLAELAESMKANGLIQPIVVEPGADGVYILHDGERRLRAATILGWTEIECHISEIADNQNKLIRALVANLQRADLNPIEEARAYKELQDMGMTNVAISNIVGRSTTHINGRVDLLRLDPKIQDMVAAGILPIDRRVTSGLLSIPEGHRFEFAKRISNNNLSIKAIVTACERYVQALDERIGKEDIPALKLGSARAQVSKSEWDALRELGKLPPWETVKKAAQTVCDGCGLRDVASSSTCRDCPAVELIRHMMEQ